MANTLARNYPKPVASHFVSEDVTVLVQALDMIDADIASIIQELSGKAPTNHSHSIGDIDNLSTELGNKAPSNHKHAFDDIEGVSGTAGAADGYVLVKAAGKWVPQSAATALAASGFGVPPGSVVDYAGNTAPSGYLFLLGQVVPRGGDNAKLFSVLGTRYGAGDGLTTFALPNRPSDIGGAAKLIKL